MHNDAAWRAVVAIAAAQHGAFHSSTAADHNVSRARLRRAERSGMLDRPHPEVWVIKSTPSSWWQRASVATLAVPGSVLSHRAAARLHRFDGREGGTLDITVRRGIGNGVAGANLHRWSGLSSADVTTIDGLPTTSAAVTLCQLGAVVDPDAVHLALTSAVRRGVSARWIEQTLRRLWRPGPTGLGVLADLLDRERSTDGQVESVLEFVAERFAVDAGLPTLVRQHRVIVGGVERRIDLAVPAIRWGIEAHSLRYHFGSRRGHEDAKRHLEFAAAGWSLEYLTWWMIKDPDTFAELLGAAYRRRLTDLQSATGV